MKSNTEKIDALERRFLLAAEKLETEIKSQLTECKDTLDVAPAGRLHVFKKGSKEYYEQRIRKKGKVSCTYIPKENRILVNSLAEKAYAESLSLILEKNIDQLDEIKKCYVTGSCEKALRKSGKTSQRILEKIVYQNRVYIEKWSSEKYQQNPYHAELRNIRTLRGDHVRSKGERQIADHLFLRNIPYRTDAAVQLPNGETIYADFIIINPVDLEVFYWEHCGLLDNQAYVKANYKRIAQYASIGAMIGQNLIITGEDSKHVLTDQNLDRIIQAYLF